MGETSAEEPLGQPDRTDLSRIVPAEDSPVLAGPATVPIGARFAVYPERIVLRFPPGCSLFLLVIPALIGTIVVLSKAKPGPWQQEATMALILGALYVAFLWFWYRKGFVPRVTFDKEAGHLLLGWKGKRGNRPLSSIIGIQVMFTRKLFPGAEHESINPMELLNRLPMRPGKASIPGQACLVPKSEDVLLLRARSRFRWIRLIPSILTLGAELFLVWLAWFGGGAGQAGLGWTAAFVLAGGLMSQLAALKPVFLYRDRFDKQSGLVKLGFRGIKGSYPLSQVMAVQLIPGGVMQKMGTVGPKGECISYQMNLVIADPYDDRLNLTNDSDLEWTRRAGRQLADFLGVSLIDQIAEE